MNAEIASLSDAASQFARQHGNLLKQEFEKAASPLVAWITYVKGSQMTEAAPNLVDGLHATVIETLSCISMGLVRPAVFSIRTQVDITFAWLYFKDHPVEWQRVESYGDGYKLPADVNRYLCTHTDRFEDRMRILRKARTGRLEDPYRTLSAHVHAQNSRTIPKLTRPRELVQSKERCHECVVLQGEISEYLNDIFLAVFVDEWVDLPVIIKTLCQSRLTKVQLARLCVP